MPNDPLGESLERGRVIREEFHNRKGKIEKEMKAYVEKLLTKWSKEYDIPIDVIKKWLGGRDGSTLPELAAQYKKTHQRPSEPL